MILVIFRAYLLSLSVACVLYKNDENIEIDFLKLNQEWNVMQMVFSDIKVILDKITIDGLGL